MVDAGVPCHGPIAIGKFVQPSFVSIPNRLRASLHGY
jgi:hypothetical protein